MNAVLMFSPPLELLPVWLEKFFELAHRQIAAS